MHIDITKLKSWNVAVDKMSVWTDHYVFGLPTNALAIDFNTFEDSCMCEAMELAHQVVGKFEPMFDDEEDYFNVHQEVACELQQFAFGVFKDLVQMKIERIEKHATVLKELLSEMH